MSKSNDDDFDLEEELENFEQQQQARRNETDEQTLERLKNEAMEEEAEDIAAMAPEELFFSRHGISALAEQEKQDKLDAELEELELEELAEQLKNEEKRKKRSEVASTTNRMRQSFARQAFDNRSNPRGDDKFGGVKKRTMRKKNRKGRKTIRKRQRKNRTRTMRKKSRK